MRVVAYALDDPGRPDAGPYRPITTLLDWERHPARELAALYAQRWEEETALDELKTHQRGAVVALASKDPGRDPPAGLGAPAGPPRATGADVPDCGCGWGRLRPAIFTDTLRAVRRSVTIAPGVFPPERLITALV